MRPFPGSRASAHIQAPAGFADLLFARTEQEDLRAFGSRAIAALAEDAWRRLSEPRLAGRPALFLTDPRAGCPSLEGITILEVVNDDMPFLLDTTLAELTDRGLELRLVAHPVLAVERDGAGALKRVHLDLESAPPEARRESLIHVHIGRIADAERRASLLKALELAYGDVRVAVADRDAMIAGVASEVQTLRNEPPNLPADEIAEAVQFLEWICADNFIFLGQRAYQFTETGVAAAPNFDSRPDWGLGILRDPSVSVLRRGRELVTLTPEVLDFLHDQHALIIAKANVKSRVHRHVHLDYIGVKRFDGAGRLLGELRIVGLFTAAAYTRPTQNIPYIRHKVARVLENAHVDPNSHFGRVLAETLETYPRDELFQTDSATLARFALEIATLQERPRLRILTRADRFDRFVSVLAYLPRDRFDTRVQERVGAELAKAYEGRVSATYPFYPEGPLVRVHYIIGRYEGPTPRIPRERMEAAILKIVRTWSDALSDALSKGSGGGRVLASRWATAFPAGYMEAFTVEEAIEDIAILQRLSEARAHAVAIRRGEEPHRASLEVFSYARPMALSERAPVLEAMGFRVISERTFEIGESERSPVVFLHDMALERAGGEAIDIAGRGPLIESCLAAVFRGAAESDGYNALVLESGLGWREAALVRALSRYLRQVGVGWSQSYMWRAAGANPLVLAHLLGLVAVRFDPHLALTESERADRQVGVATEIEALLRNVPSLDEDRILRRFLNLVLAAVRTNFFQTGPDGEPSPAISFKFDCSQIDDLPPPRPQFEIFVYSPRFEGVHLRFGKVARGGLRWSDRPQDFRTEILGLAKAQQVKNAVIVPVGAKGGFVPKRLPPASMREEWMAEGVAAYQSYIEALLDLTDTIREGVIAPPADTVRYEGDDPYLVVAADKGTATFSDIANAIAHRRGFWLDDAFASGGSVGFDHKKMGVTARGAWESVKRHFREMGTDIQTTPFTVAGVGDMSGDVFGNGMLLSPATRLVAAFDHRDIFLDPDPDCARSMRERARLFALPRSSWRDYDRSAISAGGGVFSRSAKSIPLSPQARALLAIEREEAAPNEILRAILRARVDLLWFGGIGTYVRASGESDEQVGDRVNDHVRIEAGGLACMVIGEGANLGLTQRARIEAARRGVRLNTDAIDNSAGVNTSDLEVNIKIALAQPMRSGALDQPSRNALLAEMTDEVAALVLRNNYLQTLAISLCERSPAEGVGFAIRLMRRLEAQGRLDRGIEFLPSDAQLQERAAASGGLTRPETSVLLAYAKLSTHDEVLASDVPDDPYLRDELVRYFPARLAERFGDALSGHSLRREIIATQLANAMINRGGPTLVSRVADETGASVAQIARAFVIARDAFSMPALNREIDALDGRAPASLQLELYAAVQELLVSRVVWFVRNGDNESRLTSQTERFRAGVENLAGSIAVVAPAASSAALELHAKTFIEQGAPAELARKIAGLALLSSACDIILVAEQADRPLQDVAAAFFATDQAFGLGVLADAARRLVVGDYYERLALDRTVDAMEQDRRRLGAKIVRSGGIGETAVSAWLADRGAPAARIRDSLAEILSGGLTLPKAIVAGSLLAELAGEGL